MAPLHAHVRSHLFDDITVLGVPFSDEYQTVYDKLVELGDTPPVPIALTQDAMVKSLVTTGVWTKKDVFYMLAQYSNNGGGALINWKNPGTNDATLINTPTFTSLEGFTGNGSDNGVNLNFNPNSDGANYTEDSASYGLYSRTNSDEGAGIIDMGGNFASDILLWLRAVNQAQVRFHSGATDVGANTDSSGMFIANKFTAAVDQDLWRNKVQIINDTTANAGLPDGDIYMLCQNNAGSPGNFCTKQFSMGFLGGGFTPTEITNFTDAFEVYMDSNGKGVIA